MIEASHMLIALFAGHFLVDFFNPSTWAAKTPRVSTPDLLWALIHAVMAAAITQLFLMSPLDTLIAGVLVGSGHCLTLQLTASLDEHQASAIGESARLLILLGIWLAFAEIDWMNAWQHIDLFQVSVVVLAYLLILKPTSTLVRFILRPWVRQMDSSGDNSLVKAGAMIGYLERILILSFLLLGEYVAIGFVLALKAAYRFHEAEETAKAEYMLMGTFLSFALTLVVGVGARYVIT